MDRYTGTRVVLLLAATLTAFSADYTILDVQSVPISGDPSKAVLYVTINEPVHEENCDVLIAGAGMGGVGAALAVARHNLNACVTEETDWVGGQATAGGVSALDENKFIEISGGTRTYYQFRNKIRQAYGGTYNPGGCYVSALCFEPPIGVKVLDEMLHNPRIRVFRRTQVIDVTRRGGRMDSALAWNFESQSPVRFRLRYLLDATEMGDLLPITGLPYVVGSEAKSTTNEPHAALEANPSCVQSFTYPFVIEKRPAGEKHPIEKPSDYEAIVKRQQFTLTMNYPKEFGWKGTVEYRMYGDDPPIPNNMSPGPFFSWRRLRSTPPELALMNWPRQDYAAESVLDKTPAEQARILQQAKRTSLAFLYWIQTELGHPEVQLKVGEMGSTDGMSKYPYIRESRRLVARRIVAEQDIVEESWPGARARRYDDSIGTGFYMVDIHPCGANERGHMMMPRPFQIPLASLLPKQEINFLPAGKNLGVTHLTNGAFRLHPIEWMVGEAAGTIASLSIAGNAMASTSDVQADLAKAGVPLFWFDDLSVDHPSFGAIQLAAVRRLYPVSDTALHASPDAPITRAEAAVAISRQFGKPNADREDAIRTAVENGWMAVDHRNWFHPDLPLLPVDVRLDKLPQRTSTELSKHPPTPVRRGEFFQWLLGL